MDSAGASLDEDIQHVDQAVDITLNGQYDLDQKDHASARNKSGKLLARVPFSGSNNDAKSSGSSKTQMDNRPKEEEAHAQSLRKIRSRRDSLRKAALLSLGKSKAQKEKEVQRSEQQDKATATLNPNQYVMDNSSLSSSPDPVDDITPRPSIEDNNGLRGFKVEHQESTTSDESLPVLNFVRNSQQTPTTDEDEGTQGVQNMHILSQPRRYSKDLHPLSDKTSYSKRSSRTRSPLSALPIEPAPTPAVIEWDYAETEWWGWVILVVTWIVFVMGMGSCFEVWSWAWAIGKTPYAPPELEDDPTLPIVGYYPALIILTGVMAWIWVFTAWVGMKYFRHAKIS